MADPFLGNAQQLSDIRDSLDNIELSLSTGASGIAKQEDSAHSSGHTGAFILGVRNDTSGTLAGSDGDYAPFQLDSSGNLRVTGTLSLSGTVDTELPTAAIITDDTVNPTAPAVASFPHWFDGSAWDRARGNSIDGLLINLGTNNDVTVTGTVAVSSITTSVTPGTAALNLGKAEDAGHTTGDVGVMALAVRNDGTTPTTLTSAVLDYSAIAVDLKGNVMIVGSIPHDTADAGNSVKIGSQATDYEPDTEDAQGRTDVTAADRVDFAANLKGEQIEGVNPLFHYFDGAFPDTGLDGVYDNSPTTSTSEAVECWNYRFAQVGLCIDSTLTPTDITITIQTSPDNTIWYDYVAGWAGLWVYDDTICATEICRISPVFPIAARFIRVKITCVGTDATNTFTVDDSFIYLRN